MNDDTLEDNLKRLLSVAPERARLRPMVRERLKRTLRESIAPPKQHQPTPVRPSWMPILAAAAALILFALGAWRLLGERADPSAGSDMDSASGSVADGGSDGVSDGVTGSGAGSHRGAEGDPTTVTQDELGTGSTTAAVGGGREALATGGAPDDLAPSDGEDPRIPAGVEGPGDEAPQLVAAVELPARDPEDASQGSSLESLAPTLTLWVKPIVSLPRVADPTAFEVPIEFAMGADGTQQAATVTVAAAMGQALAMGSKEAILQVEYAGFAPSRVRVSIVDAAAGTVRFSLERGVSVSGQVVAAETGEAIPGAVVVAIDQLPLDALDVAVDPAAERLPRPYAIADAFGRFTIPHVAMTPKLRLRASHAGLAPTTARVQPEALGPNDGPGDRLTIELSPGSIVTGLVEKADGTPWAGAFLVVSRQEVDPATTDRPVMTYGSGLCDSAGEFRIQGMPSGQYVALLFDPAHPRNPLELRQVKLDGSSETRVDFRTGVTTVGLDLAGTLVDSDGAPVPGASLTLSNLDGSLDPYSDWRVTDTDASGEFRFAGIQPARYSIHLATAGFSQMGLIWEGAIDHSDSLRITLPPTSWTIQGVGATGEGLSWAIFERWRPEERTQEDDWVYAGRTSTSQKGIARIAVLDHLLPGRYRAVFVGPGHGATWTDSFELEEGRPRESDLTLLSGGSLKVRALDAETGSPVVGLAVTAVDSDGRAVPQREAVLTGPDGRAVIFGAAHGPLTIRLTGKRSGGAGAPVRFEKVLEFDAAVGVIDCPIR